MDYKTFNKGCLEEAKRLYKTANADQRYVLEKLFPELRETEDEKIRKNLINFLDAIWHLGKNANFDEHSKADCAEWISWLEKQEGCELIRKEWLEHIKQSWYKEGFIYGKYGGGTSKEWTINDTTTLNELIDFLENGTAKLQHDLTRYANWLKIQLAPKVKPKFNVGEWIINPRTGLIKHIKNVLLCDNNGNYEFESSSMSIDSVDNSFHLWTIADAKDGDILVYNNSIFIFNEIYENQLIYYGIYENNKFHNDTYYSYLCLNPVEINNIYPATKEQRDLLFEKMKETGYQWDSEKKELVKIKNYDDKLREAICE